MRKFAIVLFILSSSFSALSQDRNSIRVGGGILITTNNGIESDYSLKFGPSILAAYSRQFNDFLSAEVELFSATAKNNDTSMSALFECSVNSLFTPMPQKFRFLEIGVGPAARYGHIMIAYGDRIPTDNSYIECSLAYDKQSINFGINYIIRLYCIRNERFELFCFYEPRTTFTHDFSRYFWETSNAGLSFGVKF